jgi:hypothetical protein
MICGYPVKRSGKWLIGLYLGFLVNGLDFAI